MTSHESNLTIQARDVEDWQPPEGQPGKGLLFRTTRGDIEAIIHGDTDPPAEKAVVWVWGAHGGFDGPAGGIYGVIAEELKQEITSLRVNYRQPGVLYESVMDTLMGVSYLKATGHDKLVLIGHSFGGAVVIAAAPFSPLVKAVIALSSQTFGASNAAAVSPRPLLLAHGAEDTRLSPHCSEMIYEWAQEPKELVIYPGSGHGLYQCKDELHDLLSQWIVDRLDDAAEESSSVW